MVVELLPRDHFVSAQSGTARLVRRSKPIGVWELGPRVDITVWFRPEEFLNLIHGVSGADIGSIALALDYVALL